MSLLTVTTRKSPRKKANLVSMLLCSEWLVSAKECQVSAGGCSKNMTTVVGWSKFLQLFMLENDFPEGGLPGNCLSSFCELAIQKF